MSNPRVGVILCPICSGQGEVRRYKGSDRGKLYWACECGQIRPALASGQAYIEQHATFDGQAADAVKTAPPARAVPQTAAPSPQPAPAAAPKPKPKSGLAAWMP